MSSKKKLVGSASYPKQAAGSYPVQQGAYPVQAGGYAPQPNPYASAPGMYGGAPGAYGSQPPPYAPPGVMPVMQPQQTYVGVGQFDPGARFDGVSSARVPPPPPGLAPNAAQFAMMQGGQAVVNNNKSTNFLWGGDGGVSWNF